MQRDVCEYAGVIESAPQQYALPVLADAHRHDWRDHGLAGAAGSGHRRGVDHAEAQLVQTEVESARVGEHAGEQVPALGRADHPQGRERCADGRRHARRREQKCTTLDAQELDDVAVSGDEAAARGQRLGKRPHPQVHPILDAEQLSRSRTTLAEHSHGVRFIDHEPGAVSRAQLGDLPERGDIALHREDPVDDDEHAATVARRLLQGDLELVGAVVAKSAQLCARLQRPVQQ